MRKARRKSLHNRWSHDQEKEKFWHRHVESWQKSGLSIRAYCKQHNLIESSFYAWRRELIIRAREQGRPDLQFCAQLPATVTDGRGKTIPAVFRQSYQPQASEKQNAKPGTNPFVPLRVVGSQKHTFADRQAEIILPGKAKVVIRSEDDLALVARLLKALEAEKC